MKPITVSLICSLSCFAANDVSIAPDMSPGYTIAAYYFPNYHPDPRNDKWHGPGWTEWELVKRATPRFEGHQQPKAPLWGYTDESNPDAMAQKIAAAADPGIDAFIRLVLNKTPYLQGGSSTAFCAPNNGRIVRVGANHDWQDIQPAQRSRPAKTSPGRHGRHDVSRRRTT